LPDSLDQFRIQPVLLYEVRNRALLRAKSVTVPRVSGRWVSLEFSPLSQGFPFGADPEQNPQISQIAQIRESGTESICIL